MHLTLPQAELAAQLLEEEWPDEDEVRAARMAVREEATPVPERAWALRNVASTLALGGPGERARARSLLEKALTLKEQWLDDDQHPGGQDSPAHRQCNVSQKHSDAIPGAVATVWTVCLFRKLWNELQYVLHINVPLFL